MYHVIIVLDQSRNKSYYYSYVEKDGNIECEELPPYQDILKAQSCYWNAEDAEWFFDADKHAELLAAHAAEKAAAEQAKKEAEAVPTLKEIGIAITELAAIVSGMISEKGGEA